MLVEKRSAGRRAAEYVEDGMVVGLGTGSTARHAIERLGERMKEEGLDIRGIPSSETTEKLASDVDIPLISLDEYKQIDITIDGADEVGPDFNLIKGGGGALLREKIVANHSKELIVVVDPSKMVDRLGVEFKLPVEILPFGSGAIHQCVEELGCTADIRIHQNSLYKTDNNNFILDCNFDGIDDPSEICRRLNGIPGVIENGLFINLADRVIVGKKEEVKEISVNQ